MGFRPLTFLQGKKVSKKRFDLGDSQSDILPILNPQSGDNLGDSCESKNFCLLFAKQKVSAESLNCDWGEASHYQDFPLPLGGG